MIRKKIDISKANKIYNILVRSRELKQKSLLYKIKKNSYLILSGLFERDIFNFEICTNNTLFIIGYLDLDIDSDLELILTKNMKLAFNLGRFIGKSSRFSFSVSSFFKYYLKIIVRYFISIAYNLIDIFFIIIYSIIYILFIKPVRNQLFPNLKRRLGVP